MLSCNNCKTGAKPRSFNVVHRHQGPNQITVLFIKALLGNFESSVKMMKSGTRVFSDLASPLLRGGPRWRRRLPKRRRRRPGGA